MFSCNAQFSMHWGRQCAAPNHLLDAGPGGAPKGALSGLDGGANSFFSVSYCVGKTLKSVNLCLQCPVFNALGAAHRKARRLALAEAPLHIFCVVSCWQNVKICECFLKMCGFHCIGGASVPPPPEFPDTRLADALKGASPGLGGGANPSFCVVSC